MWVMLYALIRASPVMHFGPSWRLTAAPAAYTCLLHHCANSPAMLLKLILAESFCKLSTAALHTNSPLGDVQTCRKPLLPWYMSLGASKELLRLVHVPLWYGGWHGFRASRSLYATPLGAQAGNADHETIVLDVIQCLTETGHDILGQYLYRGVAQWYCRGRASLHPLVWPPDRTVTTGEVF
jgi:hypothetical protein